VTLKAAVAGTKQSAVRYKERVRTLLARLRNSMQHFNLSNNCGNKLVKVQNKQIDDSCLIGCSMMLHRVFGV